MKKRRRGRELALQLLFQNDLSGETVDETLKTIGKWSQPKDAEETLRFAEELVRLTLGYRGEIDEKLEALSEHWKLSRMSNIDRNILRMAAAEILYREDIPPKVSIDEAIELAKRFGDEDSGRYVNGVLDRLWAEEKLKESQS